MNNDTKTNSPLAEKQDQAKKQPETPSNLVEAQAEPEIRNNIEKTKKRTKKRAKVSSKPQLDHVVALRLYLETPTGHIWT